MLNSNLATEALRAVFKEYSFGDTEVTSGQTYDIGAISNLLPTGASFKGLSIRNISGYSNVDYDGTLIISMDNKVMYACRRTQTKVTVRYTLYYTM